MLVWFAMLLIHVIQYHVSFVERNNLSKNGRKVQERVISEAGYLVHAMQNNHKWRWKRYKNSCRIIRYIAVL
jgi:hypothetical protein